MPYFYAEVVYHLCLKKINKLKPVSEKNEVNTIQNYNNKKYPFTHLRSCVPLIRRNCHNLCHYYTASARYEPTAENSDSPVHEMKFLLYSSGKPIYSYLLDDHNLSLTPETALWDSDCWQLDSLHRVSSTKTKNSNTCPRYIFTDKSEEKMSNTKTITTFQSARLFTTLNFIHKLTKCSL